MKLKSKELLEGKKLYSRFATPIAWYDKDLAVAKEVSYYEAYRLFSNTKAPEPIRIYIRPSNSAKDFRPKPKEKNLASLLRWSYTLQDWHHKVMAPEVSKMMDKKALHFNTWQTLYANVWDDYIIPHALLQPGIVAKYYYKAVHRSLRFFHFTQAEVFLFNMKAEENDKPFALCQNELGEHFYIACVKSVKDEAIRQEMLDFIAKDS